jgi:hypothetical protein
MIDIDDSLRDYATRWIEDEPAPPDLDTVFTRSRSPYRAHWPYAVIAACVLAAVVAVSLSLRPTQRPATQPRTGKGVQTVSGGPPSESVGPTVAPPVARELDVVLKHRALQVARSNGDPQATAQAVFTDYESAEAATHSGTSNVPNHPAVLIQLHGHFVCGACRGPRTALPITGRYITVILFATSPYYGTDFGMSNHRADLAALGPVITVLP